MNVVMFVDGQQELNRINRMFESVSLDFGFSAIASFEMLLHKLDETPADVFICQLGLKSCNALELLQLARMYNPDVINMATGDNGCVEELVTTFNAENLFRFITMPWLNKDDIISPVKAAIESLHEKKQKDYDMNVLQEDASVLKKKVSSLKEKDSFYERLFKDNREVFKNLFLQNYYFTSNITREEDSKFNLLVYDLYIRYYYNCIDDLNTTLRAIVNEYRSPSEGRHFEIRHNITEAINDEIKAGIVFIIHILNAFIAAACKEYRITCLIGKSGTHYLIKYDYFFPNQYDTGFAESVNSFNYKMLMQYIKGSCVKSNVDVTEKGIECRIIVS